MSEKYRNIIDYTREANKTFSEEPFNPVDSLVLSQLCYSRLELSEKAIRDSMGQKDEKVSTYNEGAGEEKGFLRKIFRRKSGSEPGNESDRDTENQDTEPLTIRDFFRSEYFDVVFADDISDERNLEIFSFAAASPRFRDLQVINLESDTDAESETQFAAMSFVLDPDTVYIAFRGTDRDLLGWKEDFNMSFMEEVPAQALAADYINRNYGSGNSEGSRYKLMIGGHSKGGNMAIYGGLKCNEDIHSRILRIFSHDGPGFRNDVLEELEKIRERDDIVIHRTVPESSIIGMLMGSTDDYDVVSSDGIGIMQHFAYAWHVGDGDFIYQEKLSRAGELHDRTIRDWLMSASYEEREDFTNTLYSLLVNNNINTLTDLKNLTPGKILTVMASLGDVDENSRKNFFRILRSLAAASIRQLAPGDRGNRDRTQDEQDEQNEHM